MVKSAAILCTFILLQSCSWVKVSPEAEKVRLLTQASADCKRLGTASSSVVDRVGFIDRNEQKVATELENLAREEAARMGGNVIVADSDVVQGRQSFVVYQCP